MKLLLSGLLLVFLRGHLSQHVSSDTIVVSQTPDVSVLEGETVNISCCWTNETERLRVYWLKNQTYIKNETKIKSKDERTNTCSTLMFPRIKRNDSGRYICRVITEIPFVSRSEGNGTIIKVTARTNKETTYQHKTNGVSSDMIVVSQTPDVSVLEGEAVNISCCWTNKTGRLRVSWLKNQTVIKTELRAKNQLQASLNKQEDYCSILMFPSISRDDSGRYICRVAVEIPVFYQADGNGTIISVITRKNTNVNTDHRNTDDGPDVEMLAFILRSLPIIALIMAFFWLYHEGTKAQRTPAVPAIKPTPLQSREDDQQDTEGGEETEERVVEDAAE